MSHHSTDNPHLIEPLDATTVRLAQITDCHIFASAEDRLLGLNTRESFASVSKAIASDPVSPDLLLATGDLSQDGSAASYQYLARRFEAMATPTFWIPGNHDDNAQLQQHFSGEHIHDAKQILVGAWQIVMLNSTVTGEVHGRVAPAELEFLNASLRQHPEQHALICLHHQARHTGSEWLDKKGLRDSENLRAQLALHGNVRGVLWGHVHQEYQQTIDNVVWMSTPSSCVQFKPGSKEFATDNAAPGYRRIMLHADGQIETRVHRVDDIAFEVDHSLKGY